MVLADQVIQKRRQDLKKVEARRQAEKQANKVLKKKLTTTPPSKFIKTASVAQKNQRLIFDDLMKINPEQSILYPSKHIFVTRINQTFKTTQFIEKLLKELKLNETGDAIFINNTQEAYQLCKYLKKFISFGYFTSQDDIQNVIMKYGLIDNQKIQNNNIVEQKYNGDILSIGEIAQMIFEGQCQDVNYGITFKVQNDKINDPVNSKKEFLFQGDLSSNICEFI